jgi:hypothetical protein
LDDEQPDEEATISVRQRASERYVVFIRIF